jgi:glycosyltransferase involved in cell wall biosynthesis
MKILFLSTWFPYPLSQGSKIRAYHLLKALAQRHEVALVSFEDMPLEAAWVDHVRQFCRRVEIVPRNPFHFPPLKTLLGWFSLQPSAVNASYSPEMAARVRQVISAWKPDCVVALTFVAAPYALQVPGAVRIADIDFPVTFMLYEMYRQAKGAFKRLNRWLAWQKFRRYERNLYKKFDLCLVVSERDCQMSLDQIGLRAEKVAVIPNGAALDGEYLAEPVPNTLIFNGALTYPVNFDAANYFLKEIFPLVLDQAPEAVFRITGRTEGVPIEKLPLGEHAMLTGFLDDVRPAVASSWACVVPLREGGGTRLKILEAMALGTPVISTSKGAEGLAVNHGEHILIADEPGEFAWQVLRVLSDASLRKTLAENGCRLIREKYNWDRIGSDFCILVKNSSLN